MYCNFLSYLFLNGFPYFFFMFEIKVFIALDGRYSPCTLLGLWVPDTIFAVASWVLRLRMCALTHSYIIVLYFEFSEQVIARPDGNSSGVSRTFRVTTWRTVETDMEGIHLSDEAENQSPAIQTPLGTFLVPARLPCTPKSLKLVEKKAGNVKQCFCSTEECDKVICVAVVVGFGQQRLVV